MNIFFTFLLVSAGALADASQDAFFFEQRGIMISQLEFEKNLEYLVLDPLNCKVPLKKEDRMRTLRENTRELEETGTLAKCRKQRVIGRRKIIQDLKSQKVAVENILTFSTPKEGIKLEGKAEVAPVTEVKEILEPVDNTYFREPDPDANFGTNPTPFDLYPGYEGLPYMSKGQSDDTLYYFAPTNKTPRFVSRDLPPGLTYGDTVKGVIIGVPRKAGFYSPTVKFGNYGEYKFKGPVKLQIYPKPRFTILNPTQRPWDSIIRFRADYAPFLKVNFSKVMNDGKSMPGSDGVRTLHGMATGKFYYEVKVLDPGQDGVVGIDIGNSDRGGSRAFGGKFGFELGNSYADRSMITTTVFKKIQKGDVVMVAYDVDTANAWIGVNGVWLKSGAPEKPVDPAKGLMPYFSADDLARVAGIRPRMYTRAFVQGMGGTELVTNFGDQPWTYAPPASFSGIPVSELEKKLPNMWDSNTTSASAGIDDGPGYWGISSHSLDMFVLNSGGDGILALSPKSSGRWQFEISSYSYAERTSMGIAPVNFNTDKQIKLGAAGTNSIGLRRQDEFVTQTGKGVIEVNGKVNYIDRYPDQTRFTFDCDFDNRSVTIYAEGKEILKTPLPEHTGAWAIAATMASTNAWLYTQLPGKGINLNVEMKYPVPGVKAWELDESSCANCATRPAVLPETKPLECGESSYTSTGAISDGNENVPHCTLPVTQAGMTGQCIVPPKFFACSKDGGGFLCSYYMDSYDSEEKCNSECRIPESVVRKECSSTGTWQ